MLKHTTCPRSRRVIRTPLYNQRDEFACCGRFLTVAAATLVAVATSGVALAVDGAFFAAAEGDAAISAAEAIAPTLFQQPIASVAEGVFLGSIGAGAAEAFGPGYFAIKGYTKDNSLDTTVQEALRKVNQSLAQAVPNDKMILQSYGFMP